MAHQHNVYDTDKHFVIDQYKRTIENQSTNKIVLIQNDHNSERFTFEIPRLVEGHDMSVCNKVEVHYLNIEAGTNETQEGIYEVDDLQVSPDSEDVVICSWLISRNATKYIGTLHFALRFACLTEEVIDYDWRTGIHSGFQVSESIFNADAVVEDYADILADWESRISALEEGGGVDLSQYALKTDIPEQVQADWNEEEETSAAYILNKPFGEEESFVAIVEPVVLTYSLSEYETGRVVKGDHTSLPNKATLEVGKTYKLVVDDDEYVAVCEEEYYLGDKTYSNELGFDYSLSNYGFCVLIDVVRLGDIEYYQLFVTLPADKYEEGEHTTSIYELREEVVTIDPKYLPDTVAMKTDIPEVPTNVSAFTNDSGYLTAVPDEYVTDEELSSKGYLTAVPDEYVTDEELTAKGYQTEDQVNTLINTALGVIENGSY